jgi:hypothetical protein
MGRNNPATRRVYDKKYRAEHPELYRGIRRAKQLKSKERVREFKDRPCSDCKQRYPFYVMDFDHRPGVEKKFKIAAWLARNAAKTDLSEVLAEIKKCDVVCANCHRIRTHERGYKH